MGALKSENPGSGSTLRCNGMNGQVADPVSFVFMQFVAKRIAKQKSIPAECALPAFLVPGDLSKPPSGSGRGFCPTPPVGRSPWM